MSNYKNILENSIFKDFIISCEPDVSLDKLKQQAYSIKEQFPNGYDKKKNKSYMSPNFDKNNSCNQKEFKKLLKIVKEFSQNELNARNFNLKLNSYWWWLSINEPSGNMRIHSHGRADLIAIFHVSLPKNSGELQLVRNDGSSYGNLYKNKPNENVINIKSSPGRLYIIPGHIWHLVTTNDSEEDRISVSFNLFFDKHFKK